MSGNKILAVFLLLIPMTLSVLAQNRAIDVFNQPPDDAKPRGYWIWGHGNYDYTRIKEELTAFKEMGLGGVDIFDMGISNSLGNIPPGPPFFSDEMLDGVVFAFEYAKKIGLKMGLSVSNGWNAGGDWTTPDEMLMRLLIRKDTVTGPLNLKKAEFPDIPSTFRKPYGSFPLFPVMKDNGFPEFYQDVSLFAFPLTKEGIITQPDQIIYFNVTQLNGNQIDIQLPSGKWVIARSVVTPLGQRMWMRSDQSNGFIMDHYSKKATKHHFEHITGKLTERLGFLGSTALERLYLCSFEAEDYIIWSPDLKEEFKNLHGYDIDPYLPVFAGLTLVNKETTERFLHDYRLTVSEMFVNNHYRQARNIAHKHGLLLASESGGPGPPLHYVPTEDLKALGAVDVMRGEFWNKKAEYFDENRNDILQVVKNIASAAHIYGHKIVEMEAFTSHLKHWQESPLELKKLADKAFCEGMTRVVYHTMPHSPKEAGYPGWSYQAGTHISPKMTWWPLSKPFHDYMARVSALLQQGRYVADVAYYYGEQIPKFASGSKFVRETLGAGYEYDDLNKEILLQIDQVKNGKIVLPSGMEYSLLVLPDEKEMSIEVLIKIEELLLKGAKILGNKPKTVYGLYNYKEREKALKLLADKLWGNSGVSRKLKKQYGKGTLYTRFHEKEILQESGTEPDFSYFAAQGKVNLDFIHRTSGNEDIYFITNKDSSDVIVNLSFRVSGKRPRLFDPVNGSVRSTAVYVVDRGRTILPVQLDPYGSVFVVFSEDISSDRHITEIVLNGETQFSKEIAPQNRMMATANSDGSVSFMAGRNGLFLLKFSNGQRLPMDYNGNVRQLNLETPWDVRFPYGWGFNPLQKFEHLTDWTKHPDKELSIFSGIATYKTTFGMPQESLNKNLQWSLDLGKVGEVARIYLNGHEIGTKVFPPFIFDVSGFLREGENHLVIEVANTWLSRLIGETRKPFEEQRTSSNLGRNLKDNPIDRPWADYPPQPSGLIGPVRLVSRTISEIRE